MAKFAKVAWILSGSLSLMAMTGCQSFFHHNSTVNHSNALENAESINNEFHLQGKIGVKTPQQSGSAFFTWQQVQDQFDIELSGILGVGKTQISGKPGQVSLNSSKTGLIEAATPEELLERATGWQAPITHLTDWVQAKSASKEAIVEKDQLQRIQHIIEDGWNVTLSYNGTASLPNKLILQQQLETGKENRITMIIQNR